MTTAGALDSSSSTTNEDVSLLYDPRGLSLRPRRSSSIRTKTSTGSFSSFTTGSARKEFRESFKNIQEEDRETSTLSQSQSQSEFIDSKSPRPAKLDVGGTTKSSIHEEAVCDSPINAEFDEAPWTFIQPPLSPTSRYSSPSSLSRTRVQYTPHSSPSSGFLNHVQHSNTRRLVNPSQSTSRSGIRRPYHVISPTASTMSITSSSTSVSSHSYINMPWTPAVNFLAEMADSTTTDTEGEKVDGYLLGKTIGWGGFSVVKEGIRGDEVVAVKIVRHEDGRGLDGLGGAGGLECSRLRVEPPTSVVVDRRLQKVFKGISIGSSSKEVRDRSFSSPLLPSMNEEEKSQVNNLSSSLHGLPSTDANLKKEREHSDKIRKFLNREIKIWSKLDHPHIVPLLNLYSTPDATYIFMPLCKGGNLLHYINELGRRGRSPAARSPNLSLAHSATLPVQSLSDRWREGGLGAWERGQANGHGLDLRHAKQIFAQVVDGLRYLHLEERVVHRDIKLENILMDENGRFRIADFGLAEMVGVGTSLGERGRERYDPRGQRDIRILKVDDEDLPGSLAYSPPEQVGSQVPIIDFSVDMWSLGCVLYALIDGRLPFNDPFEPRLKMKIQKGEWEPPLSLAPNAGAGKKVISFFGVSSDEREKKLAEDVLKGLLETDPRRRWDIIRVLGCEWMRGEMEKQRKNLKDHISRSTHVEFSDDEVNSEDEGREPSLSPVNTFRRRNSSSRPTSRTQSRERSTSRQGRSRDIGTITERSLSRGAIEKALRLVGFKGGNVEGERTPKAENSRSRSKSTSRGRRNLSNNR